MNDESIPSNDIQGESSAVDMHSLPTGEALNADEASLITSRAPTNVILFAGSAESGKTTLIVSLFHAFLKGSFAEYSFAGSETLVGFERRSHNCRIASRLDEQDTPRTHPREGLKLLHIQVALSNFQSPLKDLLLCDLSGEFFKLAKDSSAACKELTVMKRADHFVLLIDGQKLSDLSQRQQALLDSTSLLRSCLDCEMLNKDSRVDVVFTKRDILDASLTTLSFVVRAESEIKQRFAHRIDDLRFFRIAARAHDPRIPLADGVQTVFGSWVVNSRKQSLRVVTSDIKLTNCFNKFSKRAFE